MSFVRPEAMAAVIRYREAAISVAVVGLGLWMVSLGGYFFVVIGALVAFAGGALAITALRKLRFARGHGAPGLVQVTEGQITYLSADHGGFAARSEIREIELVFNTNARPCWRISQSGAQPLFIPVEAEGAEALFDAFVALPNAEPSRFLAALDRKPGQGGVTVWRRTGRLALT